MQISLNNAVQTFAQYDRNGDQQLTRQELAEAALDLRQNGQMEEYMLLATFLQGGKDGQGLFPDSNKNGAISLMELEALANGDGNGGNISTEDFQKLFPSKAGKGNQIDDNKLNQLADGTEPANTPQAPTEVTLTRVETLFAQFDADGDNRLSRQEIAQAALSLLEAGDVKAFMLFATFVMGGKDGQGIFPDEDGDGCLSLQELTDLAGADGTTASITPQDFKARYPQLAGDGNPIDLEKLKKIAQAEEQPQPVLSPEALHKLAFNRLYRMFSRFLRTDNPNERYEPSAEDEEDN